MQSFSQGFWEMLVTSPESPFFMQLLERYRFQGMSGGYSSLFVDPAQLEQFEAFLL